MDDEYGPKSHPTGRLAAVRPPEPLIDLNAVDDDDGKEAVTKTECPLCRGCGMVTAEESAAWRKEHLP